MRRPLPALLLILAACAGDPIPPVYVPQPASLEIFPGQNVGGITMGGSMRVPIKLFDERAEEMEMPPGLSFVSRSPANISVDSGTWIQTRSPMAGAWLVATLYYRGRTFTDSVHLQVVCTAELRVKITPDSITLNVGESFTPTVELSGCGGYVKVNDTYTYSAMNPGIIFVDSLTGRTTAIASGANYLAIRGKSHGMLRALPVTVR